MTSYVLLQTRQDLAIMTSQLTSLRYNIAKSNGKRNMVALRNDVATMAGVMEIRVRLAT